MTAKPSKLSREQVKQHIKTGQLLPCYFLFGEEDFLLGDLEDSLIQSALEPGGEDFNLDILYGNDADGSQIVNAASSFPMMSERRVVVVRNVHQLKEDSLKLLVSYLNKPSPTTCLLLVSDALTGKSALTKKLIKLTSYYESRPLYDNQIPVWIKAYLGEKNLSISDDALALLHINTGNSLRKLSSEIEKLELHLKDSTHIEPEDVEQIVGASKDFNIFEFCDSVGNRDLSKSLNILNRLLQLGESPIGLLVMLTRHFTILSKVKEMRVKKSRNDEMSRTLRINPYFIEKYQRQSSRFTREQLSTCYELLLETDHKLKTSYQKPKLVVETLLIQLHTLKS